MSEKKWWQEDGVGQAEIAKMTDADRNRGRQKQNVAKLAWRLSPAYQDQRKNEA